MIPGLSIKTQRSLQGTALTFLFRLLLILSLLVCGSPVNAAPHQSLDAIDALDRQITHILEQLASGDLQQARLNARLLARRFPNFALGQLLTAELESMAAFNNVLLADTDAMDQSLIELLLEAQARLPEPAAKSSPAVPEELVQVGRDVSQVILADLDNSMLYQFDTHSKSPILLRQHYIGSGKAGFGKLEEGDNKTPLGVYSIVDRRSDTSLPELYGSGALILDYPNPMDQYLGRTGYGIWLHGVPRAGLSRSPRSSEGCVTMSNEHLTRLSSQINLNSTRVILSDTIRWVEQNHQLPTRRLFRELFGHYQQAWISGSEAELQTLYRYPEDSRRLARSDDLKVIGYGRTTSQSQPAYNKDTPLQNARFKRVSYLNALATVNAEDISIFRSPLLQSDHEYTVTSALFGLQNEYRLTLYWARSEAGKWQVVSEHLDGVNI